MYVCDGDCKNCPHVLDEVCPADYIPDEVDDEDY